jgi:acetyltransferase-like isoleucine patch superfamily enzyme
MLKKMLKSILKFFGVIKTNNAQLNETRFLGCKTVGDISQIKIGTNVSFGGDVLLYANSSIEIGDNTIIGYHTILHTSTHDYNDHPIWLKRIDKPIKIGRHVWIGTGTIILPGVIVGDFSVIGAGSVVTANVPEGSIVGGNPARIIKIRDSSIYSGNPKILSFDDCIVEKHGFTEKVCNKK